MIIINVLLSTYSFHEDWIRNELEPYIDNNTKVVIIPFAFKQEWVSGVK
ncbi:hypothetical protein [Haloplasma contractile]|nr:hypothetical protein [Haloplasma contractile]